MLLCMLLMYTTAHHRIRQQSFETFWYTHHLFIPFLVGMYTHAVGCFVRDSANGFSPFAGDIFWQHCIGYQGWRWELFGGGIYLTERLYREIRARRSTKITRVVRHPYGTYQFFTTEMKEEKKNLMLTPRRCRRGPVLEAIVQVQGRTVAVRQDPLGLEVPMASVHDHLLPVRSLRLSSHPPSW